MTKLQDNKENGGISHDEALKSRVDRHVYHSDPNSGSSVINLENPYDIRPAITATLAEIDLILPTLSPNQPLILLPGEIHNRATHVLFQLGLIHALHERGKESLDQKIAVSWELSHNEDLPENIHPGLDFVVNNSTAHVPYTRKFLFHSLYQSDIPLVLSDLIATRNPENNKPILDMSDTRTLRIVKRAASKSLGNTIHSRSPKGMRLRNLAIVEKSLEILEDTSAKILIHCGGVAHVLGHEKTVYNGSLDAAFFKSANRGEPASYVMPIFIGSRSELSRDLPEDTPLGRLRKSYWVEGIGAESFARPELSLTSLLKLGAYGMASYFNLHKKNVFSAERDFAKAVIKESGGKDTFPHDPLPYGTIEKIGSARHKEMAGAKGFEPKI